MVTHPKMGIEDVRQFATEMIDCQPSPKALEKNLPNPTPRSPHYGLRPSFGPLVVGLPSHHRFAV